MSEALRRWREQLEAWAIPDRITAAVTESPWVVPAEVFARRADHYVAEPTGTSYARAREALESRDSAALAGSAGSAALAGSAGSAALAGSAGSAASAGSAGSAASGATVLDVGAGAGAASLPLGRDLIAVDVNESMLEALLERSARLGLQARTVVGRWPDVADQTPVADVVVCHHVFYNAPDLDTFATALTAHARRRVVVELTQAHPLRVLNPLWKMMHNLDRPDGPSAADAVAVLHEVGISPQVQRWRRPPRPEYGSFDDLVSVTRRRLCLPPERAGELAEGLVALGVDPDHPRDLGSSGDDLVTIWWDVGEGTA